MTRMRLGASGGRDAHATDVRLARSLPREAGLRLDLGHCRRLTLAGYDLLGLLCCCCWHVIQRKKPKLSANAAPPPASAAAALEESPSAPPRETGWLVGGAASEPSAPLRSSGSPEQGWLMGSFRVGGEAAAEADDERGPSMVRV